MMLLLCAWLTFGFVHWFDYMWNYNMSPCALDLLLGLPMFLTMGPITTIRKIFK